MNRPAYLVIVNPAAGQGEAGRKVPLLRELLEKHGVRHELRLTEAPLHAVELADAAARDGYDGVVAAGGDGTANEVLNGLMRARERAGSVLPLGVLAVGRGNDFCFGAGVPSDLNEACRLLREGRRLPLDVGRITGGWFPQGRYFGNGVGIGFDTTVGLRAARMKRVHGFAAYVLGALQTLVLYKRPPLVEIHHEGGTVVQKSVQISLMNGRRMGGTFFMAPEARTDDGLLDICAAGHPSRAAMVRLFLHYTRGTQARLSSITTGRSRRFLIRALEGELVVHADGETICDDGREVTVECLERPLEIIA